MIEADIALRAILADCESDDDLRSHLMKHAMIVQHLICHLVKEIDQDEASIRIVYGKWADMAVTEFEDPLAFVDWHWDQ
jgi:hypothetical protein